MLPLFCLLPTVYCHKGGVTPPLLCLLPTVLRRLKPAATCLLFTVCCLLFPATPVFAETMGWATTYGGKGWERANSVHKTVDGGCVVAGETDSFGAGEKDFLVLKLRADGTVEWQKTYGGVRNEKAYSVQQTVDGGYIVAGETWSFGAGGEDAWVLKLKADGTVEWQKTYGGVKNDSANSIHETSDGGYIVAGETWSFGAGKEDLWVLKLKADGTVEWQKTYGGGDWDRAKSIQETSNGGYIVAGQTQSFGAGEDDVWVLKLRPDGVVDWQKTYGGGDWDRAKSIQETSNGGYIVASTTCSFGAGMADVWVLKLKADGTVEWQKTYEGIDWDEAHAIQETRDGGYIVAGYTGQTVSSRPGSMSTWGIKAWVLKLRPDGAVEWQKTYGGGNLDEARAVQETRDGGYIVAGQTYSFGVEMGDVWILKLRPDGSVDLSSNFIGETNTPGKDSNARTQDTSASAKDSVARPQDSSAVSWAIDPFVNSLCPTTPVKQ